MNFTLTPRKIPYRDIAAEVESAARRLAGEEASELKGSLMCCILKRARPPSQNLDRDEQTSLKTLGQNRNITILPADKGNNAMVVMDTEEYEQKVKSLEGSYVFVTELPGLR